MNIQWNMRDSVRGSDRLALEQLWYTWATIGLGPLSAGFRIRAASPGLSDVSSPHVQALDRYLRYVLPTGTDPFAITPDMAPICLSLLQTEQGERILVQKTYTGRDGVGRPGAFFVHLLSNLPPDFSATQAISLWRSPFLQSSDIDPHNGAPHSGVQLAAIPFDELKRWFPRDVDIMHPRGISSSRMQDCFPLVMRAYLMWRQRWEQWRSSQQPSEPPRFYIAAPADMVAALISGITRCLPPQLQADLTFSTYEHDVCSKGQVLLVGTAWAPSSGGETNTRQDLPAVCYQEGVAINCYTYDESKTRLEVNPLAISFASYALQCLLTGNLRELDWLFSQKTAQISNLSVAQFLQIYDSYIVKAQNPTQKDVELYLESADADMLSRPHVQDLLLRLATDNPRWHKDFLQPQLTSLSRQSTTNPQLADSLAQLARAASQKTALAVSSDNIVAFDASLSLISYIADASSAAWRIQPRILAAEANIQRFLARHSHAHFTLLSLWSQLKPLPGIDEVRPFLTIQESYFESFYKRDLPPEWKATATQTLINSVSDPNSILILAQKYPYAIAVLLQQLSLTAWPDAVALFDKLVKSGYSTKINLLSILLDASSSSGKESELFNKASLRESECENFLIQFGPRYLPISHRENCILDLFKAFATNVPARKILVLDSWLKTPALVIWFESSPTGPGNMEKVLRAAALTPDESDRFVEIYGKYYLERYSQKFPAYRLPALITGYLKHYIASLRPHNLWRSASSARELLLFLGQSPLLQYLPEREQQKVWRWCDFYNFLHHPSTRQADIKKLGNILQELRSQRDAELIEKLAQAFASCATSETELASITSMMSTLLTEAELLQMLYGMAEIIRDSMISQDSTIRQSAETLLLPYIRFVLCLDSVYTFSSETMKTVTGTSSVQTWTQEQLFRQTFLYTLLQSLHPTTIASLDERARELPFRYCQKWFIYKPFRNATAAHQTLGISPGYAQPSQSIRSRGRLPSGLDTFLAQLSISRKDLKALGDILPDQYTRRNSQHVEKLARAFAFYTESETDLVGIVSIMSTLLKKTELLQMLYSMAESIRDDMLNPQTKKMAELRLEPYVRFILCFESVYDLPPDEYTLFARSFLDLLLQSADESELQKLNTANWPAELSKRWQTYLPQYYALGLAQRHASLPDRPAAATLRSQPGQAASTGTQPGRFTRFAAWLNEDAFAGSAAKPKKLKKQKKKNE